MINYSIVVVDTVPGQKVVTTDGSYTLKVPTGNYTISATSGYGSMALYGYENISVQDNGEYKIDLLLFPNDNITALEAFGQNLPGPTAVVPASNGIPGIPGTDQASLLIIVGIAIIAIIGLSGVVLFLRRRPRTQAMESKQDSLQPPEAIQALPTQEEPDQGTSVQPQAQAQTPVNQLTATSQLTFASQLTAVSQPPVKSTWEHVLRPDCRSIISVIEKNGGRITQLDLRKALPYSEAKISLMISELEDAGYLKKIKRGRGNVLILNYREEIAGDRPEE